MSDRFDASAPLSAAASRAVARLLPAGMKPPNLFVGFARNDTLLAWPAEKPLIEPVPAA